MEGIVLLIMGLNGPASIPCMLDTDVAYESTTAGIRVTLESTVDYASKHYSTGLHSFGEGTNMVP